MVKIIKFFSFLDDLSRSRSGSNKKFQIFADPGSQHCLDHYPGYVEDLVEQAV
jgi:hypothetical protein